MKSARDFVTENNVLKTFNQGKYVVFVLRNGFKVKINPNEAQLGENTRKHMRKEAKKC